MNILIAVIIALLLPGSLILGVMALNLRSSDAAGNGLALAYTMVFAIVLWGLLTALSILIAFRPAQTSIRPGYAGPALNLALIALCIAAGVSCIAAIAGLADGRLPAPARAALHTAVFAGPVAILLHIAWRTFGPPIPPWAGLWLSGAVIAGAIAAPWPVAAPLFRPAPPVTLEQVAYPAALLWPGQGFDVIDDPATLTSVDVQRLTALRDQPLLIDSLFRLYSLMDLRVEGDRLAFCLKRLTRETPTQTVRARFLDCLPPDTPEERRRAVEERLRSAENLDGMIRAGREP